MIDFESMLNAILLIFGWFVLAYFTYSVGYSLVLSVMAFFYRELSTPSSSFCNKIAVLIPAYKEDAVIIQTARNAINHNYPREKFQVIVIADSLKEESLKELSNIERLNVLEVSFSKSTKVKALREAVSNLNTDFNIGVILDADNIMDEDFLIKVNACYNLGYLAIQGQRIAKNKNTPLSMLDALSEIINNHIYRQGSASLGLSCPFIGSGMALNFSLLREILSEMKSVGGFDRDMEVRLLGRGQKVQYLKTAIVYDEKVESSKAFANQRKRWIYSQFHYLWIDIGPGTKRLLQGDFVYFNSAVLRNLILPRLLNFGLLTLITLAHILFPNLFGQSVYIWVTLLTLFVVLNVIAIPFSYYTREFVKALFLLPKVFFIMFSLLFKLKGANKSFIHTPHKNIDE